MELSRGRLGLIDWLRLCIAVKTFAELYLLLIVYHGLNNECKLIISYAYPSSTVIIFIYLITRLPKWYKNAAEGKKDVRSVNTGQSCCNTELKIVGNSNITGLLNFSNYNTRLHAALSLVTL